MLNDLDRYLASEAAQGLFADSGQFGLSAEEAIEKLSKFALPDPSFWVPKLVQSAVACGASEVCFTFERRRVTVRFCNSGHWEAGDILSTVLSGTTPKSSALRHLTAGLLGAAMGFSQKIFWRCGAHSVEVGRDGPEVLSLTDPDSHVVIMATRPLRIPSVKETFTTPVGYLFRQTAGEVAALVERTRACPIPIIVDKRPLERSYQVPIEALPMAYATKAIGRDKVLAELPLTGLGRPPLFYPIDNEPLEEENAPPEKLVCYRPQLGAEPVEGIACVYSCLQRGSRLNYVMDGVLLSSSLITDVQELRFLTDILQNRTDDLVLDLYLSTDWDTVDLSGVGVRSSALDQFAEVLRDSLLVALKTIRSRCQLPWELKDPPPFSAFSRNPCIGEIVGAVFMVPFIPHLLVFGSLAGGALLLQKSLEGFLRPTPLGKAWQWKKASDHRKEAERLVARLSEIITALAREDPGFEAVDERAHETDDTSSLP